MRQRHWLMLTLCLLTGLTTSAALASCSPPSATPAPSRGAIRPDGASRLTTPPAGASDQNPAFAPDGAQLVFTRFDQGYNDGPAGLFLLDLTGGIPRRLTPVEDQDNVNLPGAAWSEALGRVGGRNARGIVFSSDRLEVGDGSAEFAADLWRIAPDGTELSRITTHSGPPWYIEPSWSPDAEWIVFEADDAVPDDRQQGSIWKVRADGASLTPLTDGPGGGTDDRQPNWSPAGDRILFQRRILDPAAGSGEGDNWEIYTMKPDGTDIRPVIRAPSSDTDASWSPGGTCIVYSSDYGELAAPNIFIVPADGGTPIRASYSETHEDSAPSWSPTLSEDGSSGKNGRSIAFESHPVGDEDAPAALWLIAVPEGVCEEK